MKLATLASAAAVLLSAFAGTASASVSFTLLVHVVGCVLTDGWHVLCYAVFFFFCMLMLMLMCLWWCRVHPCSDCV